MKIPSNRLVVQSALSWVEIFVLIAVIAVIAAIAIPNIAQVANLPDLPVKVAQRNAILAGGRVAIFSNTGNKTLSVVVVFENPSFKERKRYNLVLNPAETKEIGGFEGWTLIPGESVTLSSEGYKSASYTFPE